MRHDGKYFKNITSAATTQVKVGNSRLLRIAVNKPIASSTITVTDDDGTTSVPLAVITNTTDVKPYFIDFDVRVTNGIKVVTSGSDNVTVVYE